MQSSLRPLTHLTIHHFKIDTMKQKTITAKSIKSAVCLLSFSLLLMSSSHREAPLIADDPLADNTDLYAFRSPDDPDKITIIANYIPLQLPQGGPNYNQFGENIRYEIHIDNNIDTKGDDIIYRFTFDKTNEDPTTFFNIRLGKQNLKTTYTLERSMNGGKSFQKVIQNGKVPPPNIGPRSISSPVGLNAPTYRTLFESSITKANSGEKVFCGPADDPFFVDLGGIFDLGDAPRTTGSAPEDGVACKNVSVIALQIDISTLQKDHKRVQRSKNILDGDFVIGVWASASRQKIRVLNNNGTESHLGAWVQVSRLGMPLTNEVVVPIGYKDLWNSLTPYEDLSKLKIFGNFFYNPELALYMDDTFFGGAIPALKPLRIQRNSLGNFGFGNQQNGLFIKKSDPILDGTALADAAFGNLLLPGPNSPRSIDLWPIFHTGVPNMRPYQLATGKNGNPVEAGKPFINNFLPNGGDMLRLNMAVPVTERTSKSFSSLGLIQAAVLGLTDPAYNGNTTLQFIPNMEGFPNGRRLEDDVTRIELQAVGGIVLAAIGFWYNDYTGGPNPVTQDLLDVLTYSTGVDKNDTAFSTSFPYVQLPWAGTRNCLCASGEVKSAGAEPGNPVPSMAETPGIKSQSSLGLSSPEVFVTASPNPVADNNTIRYRVTNSSKVTIAVYDATGKQVKVLVNKQHLPGMYSVQWQTNELTKGSYFVNTIINGRVLNSIQLVKAK